MPKLTAQRARERIEHLKRWQDQRGLTLREEEYLEALELASAVLETREAGLPYFLVSEASDKCAHKNVFIDAVRHVFHCPDCGKDTDWPAGFDPRTIQKRSCHAQDQG